MNRVVAGFVAGVVATVPMTVAMSLLHNWLVGSGDEESLPPYKITMRVVDESGYWHKLLGDEERTGLAAVAHLAYGGMGGSLYSALDPLLPGPALLRGGLYGLGFWGANYLGALPALGLYSINRGDKTGRFVVTLGSHLVWGLSLAATLERLLAQSERAEEEAPGGLSMLEWIQPERQ